MNAGRTPILHLPGALSFEVDGRVVGIDPITLWAGDWIVLSPPDGQDLGRDLATAAARLLATLAPPLGGTLELFGTATHTLDYMRLLQLRARLGFVPGYGGLLSNRSVRDNIALPLSVHGNITHEEEDKLVAQILTRFDLDRVAALRPHEVDGTMRFRACVARALALSPDWLVVEDIGPFEAETAASTVWQRLLDYRARQSNAAAVCLTRQRPVFEQWLTGQGGKVIRYRLLAEAPAAPERRPGS